jgi:hypothetical protein
VEGFYGSAQPLSETFSKLVWYACSRMGLCDFHPYLHRGRSDMWGGGTSPQRQRVTTPPTDQLRNRAVLHEANLRDRAALRAQRQPRDRRLNLALEQATAYPRLAHHLDTHGGYAPPISRSSAARVRHLHAFQARYGPLVLLRLSLPALDALGLHGGEMSQSARRLVDRRMLSLAPATAPFTVNLQRASGTHAHIVIPLAFVLEPFRELIDAAPHGRGGGVDLPGPAAHGVVMGDSRADRERVAGYVSRHPDGRLDTPGTTDYLAALEDELQRLALKLPRVSLGWKRRVPAPLY